MSTDDAERAVAAKLAAVRALPELKPYKRKPVAP